MSRQRDRREARALAYLQRHYRASALDIGAAAVAGEGRSGKISSHGKESIGLSIAIALARRGVVEATRENSFKIVRSAQ